MAVYTYPGYVYFCNSSFNDNMYRSATVMDIENAFGQYVVSTYDNALVMENKFFLTHANAIRYAIEYVNGSRN